ncbi:MAG: HD domain-containing protein [Gemmatimonadota bacterium]|nr:HD domain-containing protein [Gemmatimonadota bacterium]
MKRSTPIALAIGTTATAAAVYWRLRGERLRLERLAAAGLEALLNAIDANDADTGAHVRRVASYALVLARAADLNEHQCRSVERVALFHDIGKIHAALFDIVRDHDKLSPDERRLIATHTARGAEVLTPFAMFYPDLGAGVLSHHERWDGTGYPRGLAGEDIPLPARIVAIADSFDAMTHRRRYRREKSLPDALSAIAEGRETQFDPDLVDCFLSPPIIGETRVAMRHHYGPKRARGNRRSASVERKEVPDVTFRWRRGSAVKRTRSLMK